MISIVGLQIFELPISHAENSILVPKILRGIKLDQWEVQLSSLIKNILIPANYEVIRWTRLPYLCEGDFSRSFYSLNDIVLVLRNSITE
ncbi:unnamed protein product [Trichobilharzia regenti]|nr:unnamed protein product [Trichobilharzia regenti]